MTNTLTLNEDQLKLLLIKALKLPENTKFAANLIDASSGFRDDFSYKKFSNVTLSYDTELNV